MIIARYIKSLIFIVLIVILLFISLKIDYTRSIIKNFYYFGYKEILTFKFSKCVPNKLNDTNIDKTILIAGHTYGLADHTNNATYPKFLYALEAETKRNFSEHVKVDKIILAGDIVKEARIKNFLEVEEKLKKFTNDLLVAPGNHDYGPKVLGNEQNQTDFIKVFKKAFQKFVIKDNLFLILDTATNTGNITEEQIYFIKKELDGDNSINKIFIITHHIIWSDMAVKSGFKVEPNPNFIKNNNFDEVLSIFEKLKFKHDIYFFAGDLGVAPIHTKLFCEKIDNIHYIGTGMGNGRLDNYIKIKISKDGKKIGFEPIFF